MGNEALYNRKRADMLTFAKRLADDARIIFGAPKGRGPLDPRGTCLLR
jgi:hypothetical protein